MAKVPEQQAGPSPRRNPASLHYPLPLIVLTAPWSHSTRFELAHRISPSPPMAKVPASTHQAGPSPRRNPASSHYPLTTSLGHPLNPRRKNPWSKTHRKNPREKMHGENLMEVSLTYKRTHTQISKPAVHSLTPSPLRTHPPRHPPTHLRTCLLTH